MATIAHSGHVDQPAQPTVVDIGLAIAFGVITVALPLLRRMTAPGSVRFE
jgi:hypothetical protein